MKIKYRKKSVVVDAMKFDGTIISAQDICNWCNNKVPLEDDPIASFITYDSDQILAHDFSIFTLEGIMSVSIGDMVIQGIAGEFYPCKPEIFEKTYIKCVDPTPAELAQQLADLTGQETWLIQEPDGRWFASWDEPRCDDDSAGWESIGWRFVPIDHPVSYNGRWQDSRVTATPQVKK
jgi:hypothetical protein